MSETPIPGLFSWRKLVIVTGVFLLINGVFYWRLRGSFENSRTGRAKNTPNIDSLIQVKTKIVNDSISDSFNEFRLKLDSLNTVIDSLCQPKNSDTTANTN